MVKWFVFLSMIVQLICSWEKYLSIKLFAHCVDVFDLFMRFLGFSLDYKDDAVEGLLNLKAQLENPDHSVLYKTCSDLTKVPILLSPKVSPKV